MAVRFLVRAAQRVRGSNNAAASGRQSGRAAQWRGVFAGRLASMHAPSVLIWSHSERLNGGGSVLATGCVVARAGGCVGAA